MMICPAVYPKRAQNQVFENRRSRSPLRHFMESVPGSMYL